MREAKQCGLGWQLVQSVSISCGKPAGTAPPPMNTSGDTEAFSFLLGQCKAANRKALPEATSATTGK